MQDKVIEYLELCFKKKARVDGKNIKINVETLDGTGIYFLNGFNMERYQDDVDDVLIKRSGTGLVIIVKTK